MKVAVFGTGYVGLSLAVLLSRRVTVSAVDIVPEKVELINAGKSPIVDAEIEQHLVAHDLDLEATTDPSRALASASFAIIATPTDYDPQTNFFNTSSIESTLEKITSINPGVTVVIKSTVPVGTPSRSRISSRR